MPLLVALDWLPFNMRSTLEPRPLPQLCDGKGVSDLLETLANCDNGSIVKVRFERFSSLVIVWTPFF